MTRLNFPSIRSLPERFQRRFSVTRRVQSSLIGLTEHPVALARERNTDRTLDLCVQSSVRSLTITTKTTISLSSELRFRWSWTFWKAYTEGYTSHMHNWSKSQWIKAVFQIKNHHLVRSTPKNLSLFSKLIKINSNTLSFANVPTPPSVHHHMQVCYIFTIIFKELITQLATPLDSSNDAKLDHSSGTRWPICKQVCPSW
jgi:hypothetical protein